MAGIRAGVVCLVVVFSCLLVPCPVDCSRQDAVATGESGKANPVEKYKAAGYVNDFAELIDPKVQLEIDAVCTDLAAKRKTTMAIVTVPSLEGMSIKEFSTELFNDWGVGPKDTNRGVMVLLSRGDRQWRITVGSGLETVLTDEEAAKLGKEMLPMLKKGEYGEALLYAAKRIRDEVVEKVK
ncbi:MAG: TPM domain-containing protein [Candidatus Acidiferrum sp.]|jgi:uncharacterized protein